MAEASAYCELIEPILVEAILGAPISDQLVERARTGGARCTYLTGDLQADPGDNVSVSFDRTANLARWQPGQISDAASVYAGVRHAMGRRSADLEGIGISAAWDGRHELAALIEPDVLLDILFARADSLDAVIALAQSIEARLALGLPPAMTAGAACRLIGSDDVVTMTGRDIAHVEETGEFNPATTCEFSGPVPGIPFEETLTRVVLFRTDDIRPWLTDETSATFVADAIRAQAATYTARQWLDELGLYGATFLIGEDDPGPKGHQIDFEGACAAYWYPGSVEEQVEARFEAALGADDYVVLLLIPGDGLDVARSFAATSMARLVTERGGALTPCYAEPAG